MTIQPGGFEDYADRHQAAVQGLEDAVAGLELTARQRRTFEWLVLWEAETLESIADVIQAARRAGPA